MWNIHTPEPVSHDDAVKLQPDFSQFSNLEDAKSPERDQVKAAQKAVAALIKAVGGKDGQVYVTMSGHGNPGHEPVPGSGNETITVTVSVAPNTLPTPEPDDSE